MDVSNPTDVDLKWQIMKIAYNAEIDTSKHFFSGTYEGMTELK